MAALVEGSSPLPSSRAGAKNGHRREHHGQSPSLVPCGRHRPPLRVVLAYLQWEMLKALPIPNERELVLTLDKPIVGRAEKAGAVDWDEAEGSTCHPPTKSLTETTHNPRVFLFMVSLGFWFAVQLLNYLSLQGNGETDSAKQTSYSLVTP